MPPHFISFKIKGTFSRFCFFDGIDFIILHLTKVDQKTGAISATIPKILLLGTIEMLQKVFFSTKILNNQSCICVCYIYICVQVCAHECAC